MIEIRIHGRGGQGAVIASKILASAFFKEGKYVQSFPTFGVERRGAPVAAFIRIDDKQILVRSQIYKPDDVIVLDPTLIDAVDVTQGLKSGGWILINTTREPKEFEKLSEFRIATVDASGIAAKHGLGSKAHPIVNTAILGAFARITGFVKLESILEAITEEVPFARKANVEASKEAFRSVKMQSNVTLKSKSEP
ncbi:MAG: pyruvate ferredoxin oxidoreductase subunit gamma [Chlorobi bacterium]|nr:pyruvate ferredoxin oxidoreductase subunit gamma [Chlorobiota bacterium]